MHGGHSSFNISQIKHVMKNLTANITITSKAFMDRTKKEIYCHMSLSIFQKFVYILYLYVASVFKYHEMEKFLEQRNLIYNV